MAQKRDYKAEYARRMERGLSKAQARGHAKPHEQPLRPKSPEIDPKLEQALRIMRRTDSQSAAAKQVGVSAERLRRFLYQNSLASRKRGKWIFTDIRGRRMLVLSDGQARPLIVPGFDDASLVGRHLNAVEAFRNENDPAYLDDFVGLSVRDSTGKSHLLETRPNVLYRLAAHGSEVFEEIYQLVI